MNDGERAGTVFRNSKTSVKIDHVIGPEKDGSLTDFSMIIFTNKRSKLAILNKFCPSFSFTRIGSQKCKRSLCITRPLMREWNSGEKVLATQITLVL